MSIESEKLSYAARLKMVGRDARLTIVGWVLWAFGLGINDVLFNLYLLEAGFGEDFLGFFLSISAVLAGILAIFAGMVADRHSRKRIILVGNIVVFLAVVIQYSALTPIYLIFSQVLYGIGNGFVHVCWQPYTVSITTEDERVHVFTIRLAFFLLASLLGSLIGGFLPTLWTSLGIAFDLFSAYRLSLWTALIPFALSLISVIPLSVDRVESGQMKFGFSNVRNHRFIGEYALAWTVSGFGAGLFVQLFNVFYTRAFALDSATIGIIFAFGTIIQAAGMIASPKIVDRFGKLGTIIWFQVFSVPFLVVLAWSPTLAIAVFGQVGRALFIYIAWPVMDVFYLEGLEKDERSTAMGVINAGDSLSRAVGLNVAGWLLASGFFRAPFAVAAVFYSLSIILFYWFFGRERDEGTTTQTKERLESPGT
ncbi:MAG: MFS transporter [Candidatus Thorarchaeota archaeon]